MMTAGVGRPNHIRADVLRMEVGNMNELIGKAVDGAFIHIAVGALQEGKLKETTTRHGTAADA